MTSPNNAHDATQLLPGITGVIGPNGAGKTHLLRTLGKDSRTALGFAASDIHFFGASPRAHFRALRPGWPDIDVRAAEDFLDFSASTPWSSLSVGQRQTVINAAVLNSGKEILLFDEPFNGLDAEHRATLRHRLIELAHPDGPTIVLTSQHAEDLGGTVDHIVTVHDRLVAKAIELDELRLEFPVLTGDKATVERFTADYDVVDTQHLGPATRAVVRKKFNDQHVAAAENAGLELSYLSHVQLIELASSSKGAPQ